MGLELLMCLALSKSYIKQLLLNFTLYSVFSCSSFWLLFFISISVQCSQVLSSQIHQCTFNVVSNFPYFLFSSFDASLLLHGQQYIEIYRLIPSSASVSSFSVFFCFFVLIIHGIGILVITNIIYESSGFLSKDGQINSLVCGLTKWSFSSSKLEISFSIYLWILFSYD